MCNYILRAALTRHWIQLSATVAVSTAQVYVGLFALIAFQRLIDGVASGATLAPLLVGYVALTVTPAP